MARFGGRRRRGGSVRLPPQSDLLCPLALPRCSGGQAHEDQDAVHGARLGLGRVVGGAAAEDRSRVSACGGGVRSRRATAPAQRAFTAASTFRGACAFKRGWTLASGSPAPPQRPQQPVHTAGLGGGGPWGWVCTLFTHEAGRTTPSHGLKPHTRAPRPRRSAKRRPLA